VPYVFLRYAIRWQRSIRHQDKSPQNVLNCQHFLDAKMRRRLQASRFHWRNICCVFGQTFLRHDVFTTLVMYCTVSSTVADADPNKSYNMRYRKDI
jgi:hypothetical protein